MSGITIRDVDESLFEDLNDLCVPPKHQQLESFKKGIRKKKEWFSVARRKHGSVAKIAYVGDKPKGLIHVNRGSRKK